MGVHGLWRLIEPSGKPVPLETLENKVLAIDVSIWLHQVVKGFQDAKGAPLPNAHLLGLYHRICKLFYFRIKPVFVFDGGIPVLKKDTIVKRNQSKNKNLTEADRIHRNLLNTLVKHSALSKVLSEKAKAAIISPTKLSKHNDEDDSLYMLPSSQLDFSSLSDEETTEESYSEDSTSPAKQWDLHSIDTQSAKFKALPVEIRHEILTDLKETRKQSSWGRLHELPTESDDFSIYQMNRLLKRQSVQSALEDAEKEMGGHCLSLAELEKLLKDQGVITNSSNIKGSRIAADENTRFLLIKDIRQAIEDAKKENNLATIEENVEEIQPNEEKESVNKPKNKADVEFEDDLQKAIALSLQDEPSTSKQNLEENCKKTKKVSLSFLGNLNLTQQESESEEEKEIPNKFSAAQRYMMEYSGLTPNEITKIIANKSKENPKKIVEENREERKTLENDIDVSNITSEDRVEDSGVMSDSDSSEDFVEVDEGKIPSMEVVIKQDENFEDDLFKDIFTTIHKPSPKEVPAPVCDTIPDTVESSSNLEESPIEAVVIENKDVDLRAEPETNINLPTEEPSIPEKIDQSIKDMVQQYSNSKPNEESSKKLTIEQMIEMGDNLRQEEEELIVKRSTKERLAANITDKMYQEAQELLELFGVPYVVAPMEAEAQCAFLELIGLTNGTITDDSDIWLFGGKTVYKNFFNQGKNVMEFKSENILHHFKLSREQMILLALLVGSDYTIGLSGVGPVTALEILAAFPPKTHLISGLAEFKSWCNKGKLPGPGRTSLRSKLKNLSFTDNFPNLQVVQAYLEPRVETSNEKFSWGKPDIVGLFDYAKEKFGWTKKKSEEILNPVLRRMNDHHIQKTIRDYFKTQSIEISKEETEKKMSKRVKTALSKIGKSTSEEIEEPKKKRNRKAKSENDEDIKVLKQTRKRSKKKLEEIHKEAENALKEEQEKQPKLPNLHKKEVIPQKQKDKADMLKNKLKAIETFRKSKQGPGYVKKTAKTKMLLKEDASYLSESSSD